MTDEDKIQAYLEQQEAEYQKRLKLQLQGDAITLRGLLVFALIVIGLAGCVTWLLR